MSYASLLPFRIPVPTGTEDRGQCGLCDGHVYIYETSALLDGLGAPTGLLANRGVCTIAGHIYVVDAVTT